ncbi:YccF domain-containing protein [Streptomyces mobaraensis]|uniref:YccF domain-containing protein n=1 Tax=Streptomyces mobaraensis TaxID=35621 RepID=UPI003F4CC6FD
MRFILNIVWLVLCGLWMALGYVLAGIICCVLIVTIPFGMMYLRSPSRAGRSALQFA